MSDTLTVRKTPSEEEDARRRREGDGERGEKSVGAFSEADADGKRERLFDRAEAESQSQQSARWRRRRGGRTGGARKGRRKGRLRDRPSPERDVTEADRKKRGVCSFVTLSLTLMRKT